MPEVSASEAAPATASVPLLELLYREGCHLCEDMESLLHELLEPGSFALRRIDIDEHPALRAEHHVRVPVLRLVFPDAAREPDGAGGTTELCHHFLDLATVRQALAGYNPPAGPSRARRPVQPPAQPS